jgi:hypothetical protein
MNVPVDFMEKANYMGALRFAEMDLQRLFGYCESMTSNDTLQFDDYSKYVCTVFDENKKKRVQSAQFPKDCEKAYNLGIKLLAEIS